MSNSRVCFVLGALFLCSASTLAAPPSQPAKPRTDAAGDPLPDGVIARLGTLRLRNACSLSFPALSPDGKSIAVDGSADADPYLRR